MSLMELKKNEHIDPIFDKKQERIWTGDKESVSRAWGVHFMSLVHQEYLKLKLSPIA